MKLNKYPKFPGDNRKPEEVVRDINTTLTLCGINKRLIPVKR